MKNFIVLAIPICLILGSSGLLVNTYLETEEFLTQEDDLTRVSANLNPAEENTASEEASQARTLANYEGVYNRKLFGRPAVENPNSPSAHPEEEAIAQEEKLTLSLKGIAQVGENYLAAIQDSASGQTKFMRIGEEIAGYEIVEIGAENAKLKELETEEIITLSLVKME